MFSLKDTLNSAFQRPEQNQILLEVQQNRVLGTVERFIGDHFGIITLAEKKHKVWSKAARVCSLRLFNIFILFTKLSLCLSS